MQFGRLLATSRQRPDPRRRHMLALPLAAVLAWMPTGAWHPIGAAVRPAQRMMVINMKADEQTENMKADEQAEERRPPSAYQALTDIQVSNIHDVADALFDILDRNGDDVITKDELAAHLLLARYTEDAVERLFAMMDVNSDGAVSRVELREAFVRYPPLRNAPAMGSLQKEKRHPLHAEADAMFSALDVDDNGLLSLSELTMHLAGVEGPQYSEIALGRIFNTFDTNGDGSISRSEFRGAYVRYRAMRLAMWSGSWNADVLLARDSHEVL